MSWWYGRRTLTIRIPIIVMDGRAQQRNFRRSVKPRVIRWKVRANGRYEILDIDGTSAERRVTHDRSGAWWRPVLSSELARGVIAIFWGSARGPDSFRIPRHCCTVWALKSPPRHLPGDGFLNGQPLDRILDKGSVPLPRACAWVAEVAVAHNAAHRRASFTEYQTKHAITEDSRVMMDLEWL